MVSNEPEACPLLCFSKKNSVKVMFDNDNEGPQQIADVQPAPYPSNKANKDASELQEAAAKKAKRNSR